MVDCGPKIHNVIPYSQFSFEGIEGKWSDI